MNWNKVLNIFIVIFVVLNVFIFVVDVYTEERKYTLSSERSDLLEAVLYDKGIGIVDYLPDYYPKAQLVLSSQIEEIDSVVENLMGDEEYEIVETDNTKEYVSEAIKVVMNKSGQNEGVVSYESSKSQYKPESFTEKDIEKVAKEFAKDITLSDNEFVITYRNGSEIDQGIYTLQLNEIYKDEVIFCSYVTLEITESGINKALSRRFNPVEFEAKGMEIYPIDEALYDFVNNLNIGSNVSINITSIELGYDLNEDVKASSKNIEAIPYYRITLSNGFVDLINAYTLK